MSLGILLDSLLKEQCRDKLSILFVSWGAGQLYQIIIIIIITVKIIIIINPIIFPRNLIFHYDFWRYKTTKDNGVNYLKYFILISKVK